MKLNSVLLFALVIPFIMTYRISHLETPYWLFGLIFLGLLFNIILDFLKINLSKYYLLKKITLWFLIISVIGSAFISAIIVRHQTAPIYNIHDIVIQQESAIRFLLDGINPYVTDYLSTPLKDWNYSDKEINPALFHFVMQPFYILFSLPFYFLSNILFGFFDGRIPLLFLFLSILVMIHLLIKENERKLLFIVLFAFNPAILGYTLEGRSDIFMFAFLFASFFLLTKKRLFLAGVPLALAFAVKQSVWPILPLYVAFIYLKSKNIRITLKNISSFILVLFSILTPFLIWDYRAYLNSTVFYLSGSIENSYPISGYGFGKLLNQVGLIKDVNQYFPFHIFQMLIGLPLLLVLYKFLKNNLTVSRFIMAYGIFLFVFWYFSRYFNNSHLAYLSLVFITAYFWPDNENKNISV